MLEYALHPAIVQGLKAHLRGELICPNDRRYDTTRKVWNGMIDKYPALIVRCAGDDIGSDLGLNFLICVLLGLL